MEIGDLSTAPTTKFCCNQNQSGSENKNASESNKYFTNFSLSKPSIFDILSRLFIKQSILN